MAMRTISENNYGIYTNDTNHLFSNHSWYTITSNI